MVNARALCAGSLEFKSQVGQILHSVVNGSLNCKICESNCAALALCRPDGPHKLVTPFSLNDCKLVWLRSLLSWNFKT